MGPLVLDLDRHGVELFGSMTEAGFSELAALDSNSDGVIDSQDTEFTNLRIWQDLDQDGVSDAGEVTTLASHDIVSFSLTSSDPAPGAEWNGGNLVAEEGTFTRGDATTGAMHEILFAHDQMDSTHLGDNTESAAANDNDFQFISVGALSRARVSRAA